MKLVNISQIEEVYTRLKRDLQMFDNSRHADSMIGGMRALMAAINELPTAYDVDKVMHELSLNTKDCNTTNTIFDTNVYVRHDKAIEIVKRGGVE